MNLYICFLVFDIVSIINGCSRSAKNSFYGKFHDIHDVLIQRKQVGKFEIRLSQRSAVFDLLTY